MSYGDWLGRFRSLLTRPAASRRARSKARAASAAVETLEVRQLLSAVGGLDPHGDAAAPHDYWSAPPDSLEQLGVHDHEVAFDQGGHFDESLYGPQRFQASGFKWPQPSGAGSAVEITYSYSNLLDGGLKGDLSPAQLRAAVEEALGLWASVAPLHFVEVVDSGPPPSGASYPANGRPRIRFGHIDIDGESGPNVLAQAYYPYGDGLAGDVHFDRGNTWSNGTAVGTDFLEVTLHEVGHALGLGHEPMPADGGSDAIMNPYYRRRFAQGFGHGFLLPDDISGIRTLYGSGVGSVTALTGTVSPDEDDHADDAAAASLVTFSSDTNGWIETAGDVDWFRFQATAGTRYVFSTELVTLQDTVLHLYGTNGSTVLASNDDYGGELSSQIDWTASQAGTYFVSVRAFGDGTGRYVLHARADQSLPDDDHGNAAGSASTAAIGQTVTGALEQPNDQDWFRFQAYAGGRYAFETELGTLSNAQVAIYGSDGTTMLALGQVSGAGSIARLNWTAAQSGTYYLAVRSILSSPTGTYSVRFIETTVLGVPVPTAPVGTHDTLRPEFRWTAAAGAHRYEVRVYDRTNGTLVLHEANISTTAFTPADDLIGGPDYRWQVRATSGSGMVGSWSINRDFTAFPQHLEAPALIGPVTAVADLTPTFEWTAVPGAVLYDIWVNDQTTGQSGVIRKTTVAGTSYTPSAELVADHRYIWTVCAINADGERGDWAAHKVFFAYAPLETPTPGGAVGRTIDATPQFTWTAVAGAATYQVWVNDLTTNTSAVILQGGLAGTAFTPAAALAEGHTYQWGVRGFTVGGSAGQWSATRVFTVAPLATTPPPEIVEGVRTTVDTTPRLEWTPIPGAAWYDVWINDLNTGQNGVVRERNVPNPWLVADYVFTRGHAYQWTVRAMTDDGLGGNWAAHKSFRIADVTDVPPPTLQGPLGDMTNVVPRFAWSPITGAGSYELRLDDVTSGTSRVLLARGISGAQFTSTVALAPGRAYRWSVRAVSESGTAGAWSAEAGFRVIRLPAPRILTPTSVTADLRPTLEWTPVEHAARYDVWANDITTGEMAVIRNRNVAGNRFTPEQPLTAGHHYIWTVQAISEGGVASDWATHRIFLVTTPVGVPVPYGPGSRVTADQAIFRWLPAPGATRYDLWVNDLTTGQSAVIREKELTFPAYTPSPPLQAGHSYIWTVRGMNADGVGGAWAPHRIFTVTTAAIRAGASQMAGAPAAAPSVAGYSSAAQPFRWAELVKKPPASFPPSLPAQLLPAAQHGEPASAPAGSGSDSTLAVASSRDVRIAAAVPSGSARFGLIEAAMESALAAGFDTWSHPSV